MIRPNLVALLAVALIGNAHGSLASTAKLTTKHLDAQIGAVFTTAQLELGLDAGDGLAFEKALKSYCALRASPEGARVSRKDRFSFVNFSKNSGEKRLFVYDIPRQKIIHQIWTTHATQTAPSVHINLSAAGITSSLPVINLELGNRASFFSNVSGSNQSSVGMALTESATYWSSTWNCRALRMHGIDGTLNSKLASRAVVIHSFDFKPEDIPFFGQTPLSWGCLMLPKNGEYQGRFNPAISDEVIADIQGGPIMLFHERMNPAKNTETYEKQLKYAYEMKAKIKPRVAELQAQFQWSPSEMQRIESALELQLEKEFISKIKQTYQYFQQPSKYWNRPIQSEADCMSALQLN